MSRNKRDVGREKPDSPEGQNAALKAAASGRPRRHGDAVHRAGVEEARLGVLGIVRANVPAMVLKSSR
jgi:hypothetical protein